MRSIALRTALVCTLLLGISPLFAVHAESDALAKDPITGLTAEIPKETDQWRAQRADAITRLRSDLFRMQQLIQHAPDNGSYALARFAGDASKEVQPDQE